MTKGFIDLVQIQSDLTNYKAAFRDLIGVAAAVDVVRKTGNVAETVTGTKSFFGSTNGDFDGIVVGPLNQSQSFKIGYTGIESSYGITYKATGSGNIHTFKNADNATLFTVDHIGRVGISGQVKVYGGSDGVLSVLQNDNVSLGGINFGSTSTSFGNLDFQNSILGQNNWWRQSVDNGLAGTDGLTIASLNTSVGFKFRRDGYFLTDSIKLGTNADVIRSSSGGSGRMQIGSNVGLDLFSTYDTVKIKASSLVVRNAADNAAGDFSAGAITASGQFTSDVTGDYPIALKRSGTVAAYLGHDSVRDFAIFDATGQPVAKFNTTTAGRASTFAGAITASSTIRSGTTNDGFRTDFNSGHIAGIISGSTSMRSVEQGFVDALTGNSWRMGRVVGDTNFYIQPGYVANGNISGANGLTISATGAITASSFTASNQLLTAGNGEGNPTGGYQLAFGYSGTSGYRQFITTEHATSAAGNKINFYTNDGTEGTSLASSIRGLTISNGGISTGAITATDITASGPLSIGQYAANEVVAGPAGVHINANSGLGTYPLKVNWNGSELFKVHYTGATTLNGPFTASGNIASANGVMSLKPTVSQVVEPVYTFDTIVNSTNGSHFIAKFASGGVTAFSVATGQITSHQMLNAPGGILVNRGNSQPAVTVINSAGLSISAGSVALSAPSATTALSVTQNYNANGIDVAVAGAGFGLNSTSVSSQTCPVRGQITSSETWASPSNLSAAVFSHSTGVDAVTTRGIYVESTQITNAAGTNGRRAIGGHFLTTTTANANEAYGVYSVAGSARVVPFVARASSGQVSNLFEGQTSGGTVVTSISQAGGITAAARSIFNGGINVTSSANLLNGMYLDASSTIGMTNAGSQLSVLSGGQTVMRVYGNSAFPTVSGVRIGSFSVDQSPNYNGSTLIVRPQAATVSAIKLEAFTGQTAPLLEVDGAITSSGTTATINITNTGVADPSYTMLTVTANAKNVFRASVAGYGGEQSVFNFGSTTNGMVLQTAYGPTQTNSFNSYTKFSMSAAGNRMTFGYYYNEYPGAHVFNGAGVGDGTIYAGSAELSSLRINNQTVLSGTSSRLTVKEVGTTNLTAIEGRNSGDAAIWSIGGYNPLVIGSLSQTVSLRNMGNSSWSTLLAGGGQFADSVTAASHDVTGWRLMPSGSVGGAVALYSTVAATDGLRINQQLETTLRGNLTINSAPTGTEAGVILQQAGVSKWQLYDAAGLFRVYNYGTATEALTINAANNASIFRGAMQICGVNASEGLVQINNGGNYGLSLTSQGNNGFIGAYATLHVAHFSTPTTLGSVFARFDTINQRLSLNEDAPQSTFALIGGVAIGSSTAFSRAAISNGSMVVQGNVGIGTTSPTSKLDVAGAITASGQVQSGTAFVSRGTASLTGLAGISAFLDTIGGSQGRIGAYNLTTSAYVPFDLNNVMTLPGASGHIAASRAIRSTDGVISNGTNTQNWSGVGAFMDSLSGAARFGSYNGTSAAFAPLQLWASSVAVTTDGTTPGPLSTGAITASGQHVFNSGQASPNGTVATFQTAAASGGFSEWRFRHNVPSVNDASVYIGSDSANKWLRASSGSLLVKNAGLSNIASFNDDLSTTFGGSVKVGYNGSNNIGLTDAYKYNDNAYFVQYNGSGSPTNVLQTAGGNTLAATTFSGAVIAQSSITASGTTRAPFIWGYNTSVNGISWQASSNGSAGWMTQNQGGGNASADLIGHNINTETIRLSGETGSAEFSGNIGSGIAPVYPFHTTRIANTVMFGAIPSTWADNDTAFYCASGTARTGTFNVLSGSINASANVASTIRNTGSGTVQSTLWAVNNDVLSYYLTNGQEWIAGIDASDSSSFKISPNGQFHVGTPAIRISTAGVVALNNRLDIGGVELGAERLNVFGPGSSPLVTVQTQNTTSARGFSFAGAVMSGDYSPLSGQISCAGVLSVNLQQNGDGHIVYDAFTLGTGDMFNRYQINGGQSWSAGLDNSDSDAYVISAWAALGTNNALRLGTDLSATFGGAITASGGIVSQGNLWAGIAAKRSLLINSAQTVADYSDNLIIGVPSSHPHNGHITGINNTAVGGRYYAGAGSSLTSGSNNSLFGQGSGHSLTTQSNNTLIGALTCPVGSDNIAIGSGAGFLCTGDNNIYIGNSNLSGFTESNTLRLGNQQSPVLLANLSTGDATFKGGITANGNYTATGWGMNAGHFNAGGATQARRFNLNDATLAGISFRINDAEKFAVYADANKFGVQKAGDPVDAFSIDFTTKAITTSGNVYVTGNYRQTHTGNISNDSNTNASGYIDLAYTAANISKNTIRMVAGGTGVFQLYLNQGSGLVPVFDIANNGNVTATGNLAVNATSLPVFTHSNANQALYLNNTSSGNSYLGFQTSGATKWLIGNDHGLGTDDLVFYNAGASAKVLSVSQTGAITASDTLTVTANATSQLGIAIRGRASDNAGYLTFNNNAGTTQYGALTANTSFMAYVATGHKFYNQAFTVEQLQLTDTQATFPGSIAATTIRASNQLSVVDDNYGLTAASNILTIKAFGGFKFNLGNGGGDAVVIDNLGQLLIDHATQALFKLKVAGSDKQGLYTTGTQLKIYDYAGGGNAAAFSRYSAEFNTSIQQGYNTITPSARWEMLATGSRRAQVYHAGTTSWQTTFSEVAGAGGPTIGLYDASPVARATTAQAPATHVAGAGTAVKDDDTFDGYTIAQVVAALRALGALT